MSPARIFLVMDEGSPVAAFTARPELKAYLLRPLDAFINPLVYSFRTIKHTDHHDHVGGAGGRVSGSADV